MSKHAAARTFDDEQALNHAISLAILAHIQRNDALIREREEALRQMCTSQEFGRYLMELALRLSSYGTPFEVELVIVLSRTDNDYFISPIGIAECRTALAREHVACKDYIRAIQMYCEALTALAGVSHNRRSTLLLKEIGAELPAVRDAL